MPNRTIGQASEVTCNTHVDYKQLFVHPKLDNLDKLSLLVHVHQPACARLPLTPRGYLDGGLSTASGKRVMQTAGELAALRV
jgi:hypothetical protein